METVLQPKNQQNRQVMRCCTCIDQCCHAFVYVCAIAQHELDCWPRQQASLRSAVHVTGAVIVRVEQEVEAFVEDLVIVDVRHEVNTVFAADAVARMTGVPGVAVGDTVSVTVSGREARLFPKGQISQLDDG